MASPSSSDTLFCPYVGLRPYELEDRDYFFGRQRDQTIIASNVKVARLTILYGPSGAGKSSILQAGVFPQVAATANFRVVYFAKWQGSDFLSRLTGQCIEASGSAGVDPDLTFDDMLAQTSEIVDPPLVILLDQFEEYLLYHPESDAEDSFDAQLARAINREDVEARFLFGLREDSLAKLDRYKKRIPNLLSNTLRLQQLDLEGAQDACHNPLVVYNKRYREGKPPITAESSLVQEVLNEVRSGEVQFADLGGVGKTETQVKTKYVETAFLQLVMTEIWNQEMREGSNLLRLTTLTKTLGGAKKIVERYLDRVMQRFTIGERAICAAMFQFLVTPTGVKIAQQTEDLVSFAGGSRAEVEPVLLRLDSERIVRRIDQVPQRYEIFHDVLAAAILDWRKRFRAEEEAKEREAEAARQRALDRAQAEREAEHERAEERAKMVRRLYAAVVLLIVCLVAAAGAGVYALEKKAAAEKAEGYARLESMRAKQSADLAEKNRKVAEQLRKEAEAAASKNGEIARLERVHAQEAEQARMQALAAEKQTEVERDKLAREVRISRANELAAAATDLAGQNDQLSLLLGYYAAQETYAQGEPVTFQARQSLERAVAVANHKTFLVGHRGEVRALAISPDGRLLASAGFDGLVLMWELKSGQVIDQLLFPSEQIGRKDLFTVGRDLMNVTFSADGRYLAAISVDGEIEILDGHSFKQLGTLQSEHFNGFALGFDQTGRYLITAGDKNAAEVWDWSSRRPVQSLQGHKDAVMGATFSADNERIATISKDYVAKIWDRSGHQLYSFVVTQSPETGVVPVVTFSHDSKLIATCGVDKNARVWDAVTGQLKFTLTGHTKAVADCGFSPDDKQLVTAGEDSTGRFWNTATGTAEGVFSSLPAGGNSGNKSEQGPRFWTVTYLSTDTVAFGGTDRKIRMVQVPSLKQVRELGPVDEKLAVASGDGRVFATYGSDGFLRVWDVQKEKLRRWLDLSGDEVEVMGIDNAGQRIATGGKTAKVWRFGSEEEEVSKVPLESSAKVTAVSFSLDGAVLAAGQQDGILTLFNSELKPTGKGKLKAGVVAIGFSPDGRFGAAEDASGEVKVWDLKGTVPSSVGDESSNVALDLSSQTPSARGGLAFSTDEKMLGVTTSLNLRILSPASGLLWNSVKSRDLGASYRDPLGQVAFRPNGNELAVVSGKTLQIWDAVSGTNTSSLSGSTAALMGLAYSDSGDRVRGWATDQLFDYPLQLETLFSEARGAIGAARLTQEECKKYFKDGDCPTGL